MCNRAAEVICCPIARDPTDEMTDEFRYYLLRKRLAEKVIVRAFRAFRDHGIEPVLIKGWAASRNYPETKPRFFGDTDLAVCAADYERARSLVETESDLNGVDLHRELRHLDSVNWDHLLSRSELVSLDGVDIRILSAEDHLRVMCVHWLTNGGEDRERLWDIVYAVRYRPVHFDWSKCLDVVNATRRSWIVATIGVAHKYLDLELDGIPFADEARSLPTWLTACIEKEWEKALELRPLESQLRYPSSLFKQIMKRIPPNPIHATIDCEGDFSDRSRLGYQLRNMFRRLVPSVRRVSAALREKQL